MKQNKVWMSVWLISMVAFVAACNMGNRIAEEAIDQIAGDGAVATMETLSGAVATEVIVLATEEAGAVAVEEGEGLEVAVDEPALADESTSEDALVSSELVNADQNDANSGRDAGMGDDPLPIVPGVGYPGLLTGFGNGGDVFDVYQFQVEPDQIVRVVLTSGADNEDGIFVDLSNGDGYDQSVLAAAGETVEVVMGSSNAISYKLDVTHNGTVDVLSYSLDLVIESENDAGTAADAGDDVTVGTLVSVGTAIQGVSIGNETGANDRDCYTFEQPQAEGGIAINLSAPTDQPYSSFMRAELFDAAGEFLISGTAPYGESYTIEYGIADYESAAAGNYTVCLQSYANYAYGMYELTISVK